MELFSQLCDYVKELSPSFLCGIAGVASLGLVSALHKCLNQVFRLVREEQGRRQQKRMKGVVIRSYKGIRSVEVRMDLLLPRILNSDEVLLKVFAAGLDTMDFMITKGYGKCVRSYLRRNNEHVDDESTIVLGRECSGIVVDIGKDVTTVSIDDKVWAISPYCSEGLMSEYAVVKETYVSHKPKNLSFEEAASFPYTAIQICNAMDQANLSPDSAKHKRILLITGNSPLGLFAMQLLKAWGADVTTTVPTAGLPMCHRLGADDVVVYSVTDFEAELRRRKSFDLVLNGVGTVIHQLCVDVSSPGGKVVTFTKTPNLSDKFDVVLGSYLSLFQQIMAWIKKLKQGLLTSFWWNNFSYDKNYLRKTAIFIEDGKIVPIIEQVYNIDEAPIAFKQLAQFENVGKNVLRFPT